MNTVDDLDEAIKKSEALVEDEWRRAVYCSGPPNLEGMLSQVLSNQVLLLRRAKPEKNLQ